MRSRSDRADLLRRLEQMNRRPLQETASDASSITEEKLLRAIFGPQEADSDPPTEASAARSASSGSGFSESFVLPEGMEAASLEGEAAYALQYSAGELGESFSDLAERFCGSESAQTALARLGVSDTQSVLFMDIETAGLWGNPLFLIGVMARRSGDFRIQQYFARDFSEERAVISLYGEALRGASCLITFNGASFDIPFIRRRAEENGLRVREGVPHLDLLHAGRRAWGDTLPSCRLSALESAVCGLERGEDLPGSEIPAAYKRYLRTGVFDEMEQALRHNAFDLAAMAEAAHPAAGRGGPPQPELSLARLFKGAVCRFLALLFPAVCNESGRGDVYLGRGGCAAASVRVRSGVSRVGGAVVDRLKIACIGGGTGLSTLLRGIRHYSASSGGECPFDLDRLTAIVSVSDDGGSSGRLIDEFGSLPPGDIRNCLVALAKENETMCRLFEHRFNSSGDLRGHSVGNLLLIALTDLFGTFPLAIREAARVLAVRGRILPVTVEPTLLCAELLDGEVVCGESQIPNRRNRSPIGRVFLRRRDDLGSRKRNPIRALPEAVKSILEADAVVIGPGSLFTSILPNLAVPEIAEALRQTEATIVYVGNVMIEPGETDGFSLTDHVEAVRRHGDIRVDYVLANSGLASDALLRRYYQQAQRLDSKSGGEWSSFSDFYREIDPSAEADPPERALVQTLYREGVDDVSPSEVVEENLIWEADIQERGERLRVLRHNPLKLSAAIADLLRRRYGR